MGDFIYPPRSLPGAQAQEWGRTVEVRQNSQETRLTAVEQGTASDNRALSAQLSGLADQVRDLRGRVGYVADGTGTNQTWTTPTTIPYIWGPALTFTLSEKRVVSLQFTVSGTVSTSATNASTFAFAYIRSTIFINGNPVANSRGQMGTNVGIQPNTGRSSSYDGVMMSRALVTLPAGTYTVQGGFDNRDATVSGSPAAGGASVRVSDPFVFADVLQTA